MIVWPFSVILRKYMPGGSSSTLTDLVADDTTFRVIPKISVISINGYFASNNK